MPTNRFEPSSIKNKVKREEIARKQKKAKRQDKLQRRLAQAKVEANDPLAKKVRLVHKSPCCGFCYTQLNISQKRLAQNVPRTLDNTREYDPSILTANPNAEPEAGPSTHVQNNDLASSDPSVEQPQDESAADIAADPFAAYFSGEFDPSVPPKVLITTSPKATRVTYDFCDELVGIFPGAEFIRRKKGKGFEMGRIAGWAANRGYSHLMVVNEDMKKPSESMVAQNLLRQY